jgi:hypothetical protein
MVPGPVKVGTRGRSMLSVLLVRVKFSGEYDRIGTSSIIVMLMVAEVEPPELLAQTV